MLGAQRAGQQLYQPGPPAPEGGTVRRPVLWVDWPPQLRTEPPLPGEAAPHQPCEGTQPGPPPRSPACRSAPFGEPPASNSLRGHRQGGISLPRELAPWMRLAPACTGVRGAFQDIRMADSHQQRQSVAASLTRPADTFPATWDPGPAPRSRAGAGAPLLRTGNFPLLQGVELRSALEGRPLAGLP